MDYINAPVGKARAPQHPLKPLVAVPTTTGTGQREHHDLRARRAVAARSRPASATRGCGPTLAVVDPRLTLTPAGRGHRGRRHGHPVPRAGVVDRAAVHVVRAQAARAAGALLRGQPGRRHVGGEGDDAAGRRRSGARCGDGDDEEAREQMALAATFAGMGFGNAGVHIPHANAYPIAGRVRDFHPAGYPADEPMVPHGMAVSLTAPEAFRFTFDAVARAAPAGRRAARRGGRPADEDRDALPARAERADARHRASPTASAPSGTARPTCPTSSRERSSSSGCWPPRRKDVTEDDLAAILERVARAVVSRDRRSRVADAAMTRPRRRAARGGGRTTSTTPTLARSLYSTDASIYRVPPRSWSARGTSTRSPRCSRSRARPAHR